MASCFSCGAALNTKVVVSRRDSCDRCGADIKCCRNCAFYDPAVANECREPVAEAVREKDRSNFCDFFTLADGQPRQREDKAQDAKRKLEDLFKKSE